MQRQSINRRHFIKWSSLASGGLVIGFQFPSVTALALPGDECTSFQPNAYLKIDTKGKVTVFVAKQESGQGVDTALPMIVAEELDADYRDVHAEIAPFGTLPGGEHDTGGSQSVTGMYTKLRQAGAIAKSMLISAAAAAWKIPVTSCAADNGEVVNTVTMQRARYGDLVCEAAKLPVPKEVMLKSPKDFKLIGKSEKRAELKNILSGQTKYSIDLKVEGMAIAVVARCPVLGGSLESYDDTATLKVPGVLKVVSYTGTGAPMHVHPGVAVIATNTWAAMKGREALQVKWKEGPGAKESTEALFSRFKAKAQKAPEREGYTKGNIDEVAKQPVITAEYQAPFLAHAAIEPVNFIAAVKGDSCEVWGGLQLPDWAVNTIATEAGFRKDHIKVNLALMGGTFGRRLFFDFAIEAVKIAKQFDRPVKLIWDRKDDMMFSPYRPANYHKLTAHTRDGSIVAWQHHVLTTPIAFMTEGPQAKNIGEMDGADKTFWYTAIPNIKTGYTPLDFPVNRNWLRAVDVGVNAFAIESFIDEVAVRLKKDPLQFRLSMLEGQADYKTGNWPGAPIQSPGRVAGVLKLAAEKIGWTEPRKKGHFIGLACHSFIGAHSFAAHAIEIESIAPKRFRIVKVVAAIDCGLVVNPDGVINQMEGGVAFALTHALKSEITVKDGRVQEESFMDFELLRYDEMPPVEVYMVKSEEAPGGVGELGVATVAPALCNALAAAGERPRSLPIRREGFHWM